MRSIVRLGTGLFALVLATNVGARGGRDASYGTNGVATMAMTDAGGVHPIELAPDGTIVGMVGSGGGTMLYRAFADGSLDLSFGTSGLLDLPNDEWTNVVVAPDGKILLLGVTQDGAWLIRRLGADGVPDPTFGTGGEVVSDHGPNYDYPYNLTFLADGRFVVSGTVYPDVALARYDADGTLDASFGTSGLALHDFGGGAGEFLGRVAEQPDGKLVAGLGSTFGSATGAFAVARFEEDGTLDAGFGSTGPGYTKFTPPGGAFGTSIALQPDGKILLTGTHHYDIPQRRFAVLRFLPSGALDPDFGTGGISTVDFLAAAEDESRMLHLLPDGRIMVIGQAEIAPGNFQIMVARFLPDGALDGSFGLLGSAATPVDDFSQPTDTVLLPDGDLLVAGSSFPANVRNFTERITMCGACDVAVPGGCVTAPPEGCRAAGSAVLTMRRTGDGTRDAFTWKYRMGPATAGADFGDPSAGDDLQLCLWFQSSIDGIIPIMRTSLAGGGTCGMKPCWKALGTPAGTKGHRLRDRTLSRDGVASAVLKPSTVARTTIAVKAKGARIRHPAMPLGADVKARLQSAAGQCWEATFPSGTIDTPAQYKAKTP